MGYWFNCFPQLDAEKYYFISPILGQSSSSCEREKEASLHGGEGEKRERKEWQSDEIWSRATHVAETPKQAEGGTHLDVEFLPWFSLTILFCPRCINFQKKIFIEYFLCAKCRETKRQQRIQRKYVRTDNGHLEGHACHRNRTN